MAGLLDLLAFHHRMLSIFGKSTHGEYDPNTSPIYTRYSSFPFPFHYPSRAPIKSTNILMFSLHTILAVLERARPPRESGLVAGFRRNFCCVVGIGAILGFFCDNAKEAGNYYSGFRLGWAPTH